MTNSHKLEKENTKVEWEQKVSEKQKEVDKVNDQLYASQQTLEERRKEIMSLDEKIKEASEKEAQLVGNSDEQLDIIK